MAPRRSGSGGNSNTSSSGPSTCYNSNGDRYPCSVEFYYNYGDIDGPLYSNTDLRGQLISYACWVLITFVVLIMSLKPGARLLQMAMLSFLTSFAFLCARYALLLTASEVPIAYRFESSVVVLMWRLGMIALLTSTLPSPTGKACKIYVGTGLVVYATLSIVFVVFDFIISSIAVEGFKTSPLDYGWKITDRDFGLTLTQAMLNVLQDNSRYYGDTGYYVGYDNDFVQDKMYDVYDGVFHQERGQQARIGVAADILALVLVVSMFFIAVAVYSGQKEPARGNVRNEHQHGAAAD
jgi:hypothetical protein